MLANRFAKVQGSWLRIGRSTWYGYGADQNTFKDSARLLETEASQVLQQISTVAGEILFVRSTG
jgi:hypothetical protein